MFTALTDEIKVGCTTGHRLAAGLDALQADTFCLKEVFETHMMVLQSVQKGLADALAAARLGIADVQSDLALSTRTVVDSIAQEGTSTRTMLKTFFCTVSNDRLADRAEIASIQRNMTELKELLTQCGSKRPSHELVQHHYFFDVQQLRVAGVRVLELSPLLLPVISRAVISDEAVTAAIVLAMTASSSADRVAYGIFAFFLFIARKACQIYKSPVTVHVVFVEDFFGLALEIPASECSNREVRSRPPGSSSTQSRTGLPRCAH